jgi:hypothetical protein
MPSPPKQQQNMTSGAVTSARYRGRIAPGEAKQRTEYSYYFSQETQFRNYVLRCFGRFLVNNFSPQVENGLVFVELPGVARMAITGDH